MQGKKEALAHLAAATGLTRLLEALPRQPFLLILNYHRIGVAGATPYDSGTYSCTTAQFDAQIQYFQRYFDILDLDHAADVIHGSTRLTHASLLLTFDDGYLDNYTEAYPVLRRHNTTATFFLPTAFTGTGKLPWWDVIAWIVKHSTRPSITLTYPETRTFDLSLPNRSIPEILKLFKQPATTDADRFLADLEQACDAARPPASTAAEEQVRTFLNWGEAREMQANGMHFGSHTHTHEILSKLPLSAQIDELRTSRDILEHELGRTVDTLAYPVGQPDSFSADTVKALQTTSYRTAFSFFSGINKPGHIAPFNVLRTGVDASSDETLRLRTSLQTVFGSNRL